MIDLNHIRNLYNAHKDPQTARSFISSHSVSVEIMHSIPGMIAELEKFHRFIEIFDKLHANYFGSDEDWKALLKAREDIGEVACRPSKN